MIILKKIQRITSTITTKIGARRTKHDRDYYYNNNSNNNNNNNNNNSNNNNNKNGKLSNIRCFKIKLIFPCCLFYKSIMYFNNL